MNEVSIIPLKKTLKKLKTLKNYLKIILRNKFGNINYIKSKNCFLLLNYISIYKIEKCLNN
jgi:hypothetical protein